MELLRFTIAAGETKRFERAGRYFEVVRAPLTLNIIFSGTTSGQDDRMLGAEAGFWAAGPFAAFEVTNPETSAQSVVLMITDGQGGYRGIPNVINATLDSAAITERGRHFIGFTSVDGTNLGLIDSATGAGIALHELHITAGVASEVTIFTAQNATSVTLATIIPAPPAGFQSMIAGGADSAIGRKRCASSVTLTGRKDVAPLRAAANVTAIWRPAVPFVMTGTNLLGVACGSGSVFVAAVIEEL